MGEVGCLKDGAFKNLQVKGTIDGSIFVNNGINIAPVVLTPAASVTIFKQTHSGRLNLIPLVATGGGADAYLIPIPTQIGETYRFAWSGIAADGDDILFQAPSADAWTMTGGILYIDTDATDASGYVIAFPAADDDKVHLVDPESFDITFIATTLTNYHMSGYAMSTGQAVTSQIPFGDI